jgi:hypothetical protein
MGIRHSIPNIVTEEEMLEIAWKRSLARQRRRERLSASASDPAPVDRRFYRACRAGDLALVQELYSLVRELYPGREQCFIDLGLRAACYGGHIEIAKFLLDWPFVRRGMNDVDGGLVWACRGGKLALVEFMISVGATNWDLALQGVCCEDSFTQTHTDIVLCMVDRGATKLDQALWIACAKGNLKAAECVVLLLHPDEDADDEEDALEFVHVCETGFLVLPLSLLFSFFACLSVSLCFSLMGGVVGLVKACSGGHLELANLMIEHGAHNWDEAVIAALDAYTSSTQDIYPRIVQLLMSKGSAAVMIHKFLRFDWADEVMPERFPPSFLRRLLALTGRESLVKVHDIKVLYRLLDREFDEIFQFLHCELGLVTDVVNIIIDFIYF